MPLNEVFLDFQGSMAALKTSTEGTFIYVYLDYLPLCLDEQGT